MGSFTDQDGAVWVRQSAFDQCPSCSALVPIQVPAVKRRAIVPLYGEEAIRRINDQGAILYTYSLVGTSKPLLSVIETKIRDLKRSLIPHIAPNDWQIHMKVIWSGDERKKRPEFERWSAAHTAELISGIGDIVRTTNDAILGFNIVLVGEPTDATGRQRFESHVRDEAYAMLVMNVVDRITSAGGQPVITFDSQKQAKADKVIHDWATKSFNSSQATLLYSFLSHSIIVPEPEFVRPASHPLLELADFMSFAVARHHLCMARGERPEIDLRILGNITYMTLSNGGNDLLFKQSVGFPWKMQYPRCDKHIGGKPRIL